MTKLQILEKSNKDLRVRLRNAVTKMEIEREENQAKLIEQNQLEEKDSVILMLQREILCYYIFGHRHGSQS